MNASYYITALLLLSHALSGIAEPGGILSITMKMEGGADFAVQELNVADGTPQTILQQANQLEGIDAPPWLGDPVIVNDTGAGGTQPAIRQIGHYVTSGTVIDYSSVTRPADPGFSCDGELIVFVSQDTGPNHEDELHTITPGRMNHTTLYAPTPGQDLDFGRPRFTPDGRHIMFQYYNHATGNGEIQMIAVTGGIPWKVTNLPDNSQHPAVSPDGRRRACIAETGGTMTLFIAGTDGAPAQQVNLGGEYALYPAFSPDSRYIAVISDNGINVIELATNTVIRHLPLAYDIPYGLCWHSGAVPADGVITKMKINDKSVMIKTVGVVPREVTGYGAMQLDGLLFPLDSAAAWQDKKGKKFIYKDKMLKRKAVAVVKNQKGKVTAKKLSLVEGLDYQTGTNLTVMVTMGRITLVQTVPLDQKGKYKAPR